LQPGPGARPGRRRQRRPGPVHRPGRTGAQRYRGRDLAHRSPGIKKDAGLDYRGPQVDGKRGNRHIYINWLNREPDGELRLFRRGKVMLDGLDPELVDRAESAGAALTCTVNLTSERGLPTTGFFRPHQLDWRFSGV
jgi:hypothetical protein